jgi:uncharacterized oligopeptide transporter (OPT) family protein
MSRKDTAWILTCPLASALHLCLPPLAVGMGIYLPPSLQTPLVIGAVMGYFLNKKLKDSKENRLIPLLCRLPAQQFSCS